MTFYNFLQMYLVLIHHKHLETPSRHHPDIPRHHPDIPRHPQIWASLCNIGHYIYIYMPSSMYFIKTPMSGGVLIVSGAVWMVSGWCLGLVWECLVMYWYQICWQQNNIRSWYSDIAFYSGALYCIKRLMSGVGVSGLCLGMSGWGLRVSGDVLIPNLLVKIYIGHDSSDIAFSSSAR